VREGWGSHESWSHGRDQWSRRCCGQRLCHSLNHELQGSKLGAHTGDVARHGREGQHGGWRRGCEKWWRGILRSRDGSHGQRSDLFCSVCDDVRMDEARIETGPLSGETHLMEVRRTSVDDRTRSAALIAGAWSVGAVSVDGVHRAGCAGDHGWESGR
jgi:hypothetical protein